MELARLSPAMTRSDSVENRLARMVYYTFGLTIVIGNTEMERILKGWE